MLKGKAENEYIEVVMDDMKWDRSPIDSASFRS